MSEEILKVVIPQLIDNFSSLAKNRGQVYFKEGRVYNLAVNFQGMELRADVKDNRRSHSVCVQLVIGEERLNISQSCSCPTQSCCKHVYAALLATQTLLKSKSNNSPTAQSKGIEGLPPPPQPPRPVNLSTALNDWLVKAEHGAQAPVAHGEQSTGKERKIVWRLVLNEGVEPSICLSMEVVRLLKTGEHSPAAPQACCIADLLRSYSSTASIRTLMEDSDWAAITALARSKCDSLNYNAVSLGSSPGLQLLKELVATQRCYIQDICMLPVRLGEERAATITWIPQGASDSLQAACCPTNSHTFFFVKDDEPFYIDCKANEIGSLQFEAPLPLVKALLAAPAVAHQDLPIFREEFARRLPALQRYAPPNIQRRTIAGKPLHCLRLSAKRRGAELMVLGTLSFSYEGNALPLGAVNGEIIYKTVSTLNKPDGEILTIQRATALERQAVKWLLSDLHWTFYITQEHGQHKVIFRPPEKGDPVQVLVAALGHHKRELEKRGWLVEIDDSMPYHRVDAAGEWFVDSGGGETWQQDWFDLQLGTYIDGERIDLTSALIKLLHQMDATNLLEELENREGHELYPMMTEDKRIIMVPTERIRTILKAFLANLQVGVDTTAAGQLRLAHWNVGMLAELQAKAETAAEMRWMGQEELHALAARLKGQLALPTVEVPRSLKCTLRTYQQEGLNWLQFLRSCRLNGILADDMGLGKTVQALAHILAEKESGRMRSVALVITPTSVLPNWQMEAQRFAPSLRVLPLQGINRHLYFDQIAHHDVILTTYSLLMRDSESLLAHEFHMLILDEAQAIKNSDTQAYAIVQQIRARHRLCLTGTPMENHLDELWSLFNFLLPGFLGDKKTFHNLYRKPIERDGDIERRNALVQRIKPFMLRRTKALVAKELPKKTEIIQRIELGTSQRDLYEAIRLRTQAELMRQIEEKGLARSQIAVLDALLKLRQVCCDPRLIKTGQPSDVESAKLKYLMEVLPQMLEENRKILLFSQFTSMLGLIQRELHTRNISYSLLTGDTVDRHTPVARFQQGQVSLMLLSLKAGGLGLNLTAADTVILFDPWWNPAVEEQAADRAYRMGQTKPVFVYKLVTSGTVEEKILMLQDRKKEMMAAVFGSQEGATLGLTIEDLANIFAVLPQAS